MNITSKKIAITLLILGMSGVTILYTVFSQQQKKEDAKILIQPTAQQEIKSFSYMGREGIDALTLLKEETVVDQEASGLVASINGRKADKSKREYWAFYVNRKMAEVGPADYVTKDTDKIEWKLKHY